MTRKISTQAAKAFIHNQSLNAGNTAVISDDKCTLLKLHGNIIARKDRTTAGLQMTLAGWPTLTTRERLNTLLNEYGAPHFGFFQKAGKQYWQTPIEIKEISPHEIVNLKF